MAKILHSWEEWVEDFEGRSDRGPPALEADLDHAGLPASLARSLAIFQLGESGGGTAVLQASRSRLPHIDRHYVDALRLFVAEEHRHADLLAICVRLLGGSSIDTNWTARLFVAGRRLIGLRLKVLVLLAAEVVGLVYYSLLASRLPECGMRRVLLEIVEDERSHLYFHCDFLRSQTGSGFKRHLFVVVWRTVVAAAALVVAFDHRHTIRDLDLGFRNVLGRWHSFAQLAEDLVVSDSPDNLARLTIRAL